jgi:hypothetical protein
VDDSTLTGRARSEASVVQTEPLRARPSDRRPGGPSWIDRGLGHPTAFIATAVVLLLLFGWTFLINPEQVAPTKDPAYYTWRTEALVSEDPRTLLEIEGAFNMFAGGYRVTAPVIGGYLRQIADVSSLKTTVFLMVGTPVLIALLLAGFAYRHRRDPLVFHAVAFGSGGLLLTDPFVGYLDNVLCLLWLAAAIWFIGPARESWPARIGFAMFLLLAGLTHPTTLAIFCLTLGAMVVVRLLFRSFDVKSVIRDDGPMLVTAFAAGVLTLVLWTIGPWGKSASLAEAALPPPYDSAFFLDRLLQWLGEMRPALNGPLLVIGVVGLLAAGKRAAEDDLARTSIVWLAPLAGLFGFVAGIAYPYYRFLNTTLSWILLVGLGAYFAIRFFLDFARGGGFRALAALGAVAVVVIVGTNFTHGYGAVGWDKAGWISEDQRRDLDVLRTELARRGEEDRPVVFVIDDEPSVPFQIWGFTKLAGNTSRYGLPDGQIDQGYMYLGSLDNFLSDRPTTRGEETYDKLSRALLEETNTAVQESGKQPVAVVASQFNPAGANADLAAEFSPVATFGLTGLTTDVWILDDGRLTTPGGNASSVPGDKGSPVHVAWIALALVVLLLPGVVALRWFLPDATLPDALAMAPALAIAMLTLVGFAALAVVRSPFSAGVAWACVVVTIAIAAVAAFRAGLRPRIRVPAARR